ncbi:hypothetical protein TNCV_905931 [Trichonephila clavipes]|nr:hypothetical protein TNCV_905931 [Trichonephila clavipes]
MKRPCSPGDSPAIWRKRYKDVGVTNIPSGQRKSVQISETVDFNEVRLKILIKPDKIMSASSSSVNPTPLAHANTQGEGHPRAGQPHNVFIKLLPPIVQSGAVLESLL